MIVQNWECPKLYPNETIFIIGGGPSVNETDLSLIRNHRVIGVNSAFRLGDWVDVCFFGDSRWYNLEYGALRGFPGLIVGLYPFKDKGEIGQTEGVRVHLLQKTKPVRGITTNRRCLHWNDSSGGAAVNLAVHLGAKKIVLIGFDMQSTNGKYNFHNHYPWKPRKEEGPYQRIHNRGFRALGNTLKHMGVEILNATPGSKLSGVKIVPLGKTC